ncbi:PilN domain-containing protein [Acidobacteria bacterium AH-259-D05]|nr:PilN domain-containing protein [Acidobacteria bacterium AH-259-D05]
MFYLDSAVGIEIRGSSLAFAVVSKGLQGYVLRSCGRIDDYKELPPSDLYAWVQQFEETGGLDRENVILGLPRDQVVIRQIELPLDVEENLDQVVRFQLEKFEPGDEEQSYCDYVVLERNVAEKKLLIQTIMVPRPFLDEYLHLFRELNLYPAAIRVSSVGLFHLFSAHDEKYPQKDPYLVLAIDPDGVEFVLVTGPEKFFSEKILVSQDDLTFEKILQELDRFFSHLDVAWEGLARIYLSGSLAEEFMEEFRERFEDCELLSKQLNLKRQGVSNSKMAGCVGAVGLAISGTSKSLPGKINLIPREKRVIAERPSLVTTLVLAGLLVIMGLAVSTRDYFQQRRLLDQVETQIQALQTEVDRTMALRSEMEDRRAELDELRDFMEDHQKVLLVLKELTERIPDNSFLQNINIQGDRITINGFSGSASSLLKILLDSQYLESIESRYITPDRNRKDGERFSFEARIRESNSDRR